MEQKAAAIAVEAAGRPFVSYAAYVCVDDHPPAARRAALAADRVARACLRPQTPLSKSGGQNGARDTPVAKIRLAPALSAEAAERVAPDYLLVYVGHSGGGGIALAIAVS
jgi:hypothetical protein